MALTLVANNPVIVLQPNVNIPPSLTPTFTVCDPLNGNYFVASGSDLVTFHCSPAANAPAWSAVVSYTVGQVVTSGGIQYIATAPSLSQTPPNASFWAVYTSSTINLSSAPDACTGRTSDVDNYPIVDDGYVEFRVVPGSVFTQANGQVQFQASSNLVSVLVRSL